MFASIKQNFIDYSAQLAIVENAILKENYNLEVCRVATTLAEQELTEAINEFNRIGEMLIAAEVSHYKAKQDDTEVKKIRKMLVIAETNHLKAKELVSRTKAKSMKIAIDVTDLLRARHGINDCLIPYGKIVRFMEDVDQVPALILSTELPLITSLKSKETAESKKVFRMLPCLPNDLVTHIGEFIKPALKSWAENDRHIKTALLLYERADIPDIEVLKYVRANPLAYGYTNFKINQKSISYIKVGESTRCNIALKYSSEKEIHTIRNKVILKGKQFIQKFIGLRTGK